MSHSLALPSPGAPFDICPILDFSHEQFQTKGTNSL
jgi:hypothetical protein